MELLDWIIRYWLEICFSGLIGGVGIAFKYAWGQVKKELNSLKQTQSDLKSLKKDINEKIDSIETKVNNLYSQSAQSDLVLIKDALLRKIRYGLQDPSGCISMGDAETCAMLMAQYEELGGNGEVHKLYKRYEKLNVCPEYDHHIEHEHEHEEI